MNERCRVCQEPVSYREYAVVSMCFVPYGDMAGVGPEIGRRRDEAMVGICEACWDVLCVMWPNAEAFIGWLKGAVLERRGPIDPVVAFTVDHQPIRRSETPWQPA